MKKMIFFNNLSIYMKINYIFINIQLVIFVVGLLLNIFLLNVFMRNSLKKCSYSFYCQMKACADIIVLLYVFRNWSNYVVGYDLDAISPFVCSLNKVLPHIAGTFNFSILFILSVDRLAAVLYQNRFGFLKQRWFQVIAVIIAAAYSCGINSILSFNSQLVFKEKTTNQTIKTACMVPPAILQLHSWIKIGNIIVIVLISIVLNTKLILYILSSRKKFAQSSKNSQQRAKKDRRMAISSIGISVTALVSKLPLGIVLIINHKLNVPSDQSTMFIFIAVTLLILENSFANFLNNILFNTSFSKEFRNMIKS